MSNVPFFVPDYYTRFECKGGECRRSCCGGWPIAVSQDEYFRLLGMECSSDLRRRLDCAFCLSDGVDADHFASIQPNFIGKCPMHMENGLCQLHFECGPEILPDVCRLFPRSVYHFGTYTCVCSAACERTVEMLIESDEPLCLIPTELGPEMVGHARPVEYSADREAVRNHCLAIMEDRTLLLSARIDRVARYLQGSGEDSPIAFSEDMLFAIQTDIADHYAAHSESVSAYCEQALEALKSPQDFNKALGELEARFPLIWIWLEKLIVNYMLQECFPYTDRERDVRYEGVALCGLYAFCLFLLAGCQPENEVAFVDLAAAMFRLIGHTAFDHNVIVLIKNQMNK